MSIARKTTYAMILTGYYTFMIIYSIGIGFIDVLVPTIVITVISVVWLFYSVRHLSNIAWLDYKSVVLNIFVYSFVNFYIAFVSLAFYSGSFVVNFLRLILVVSPIPVWMLIWTDYYLRLLQGKE
jgi:hypothetical protein